LKTTRFTGIRAWWLQRVSAAGLLAFLVFAVASFWLHPPADYAAWRGRLEHPGVQVATLAFGALLLVHMWVGLRDVLLDYARPATLRIFLLGALAVALFGLAVWMLAILLPLAA
jgi:succinate dehydrogenase / fumarate reductase membrane anchor subunit